MQNAYSCWLNTELANLSPLFVAYAMLVYTVVAYTVTKYAVMSLIQIVT